MPTGPGRKNVFFSLPKVAEILTLKFDQVQRAVQREELTVDAWLLKPGADPKDESAFQPMTTPTEVNRFRNALAAHYAKFKHYREIAKRLARIKIPFVA